MARFRLKPLEVEAVPYRLGLEDEFNSMNVPVLVTPTGRLVLGLGDWIITKATGEREVIRSEVFHLLYESCSTDVGFHTSERARRGIPMRSG